MSLTTLASRLLTLTNTSLLRAGLSATTRKLYLLDLRHFFEHNTSLTRQDLASPTTYRRYLLALSARGLHPTLIRRTEASLRYLGKVVAETYSVADPTAYLTQAKPKIDYIKSFTNKLKEAQLSAQTVKSYKSDLSQYLAWATKAGVSSDKSRVITSKNIQKYLTYLAKSTKNSQSTLLRKGQALKRFFQYLGGSPQPPLMSDNKLRYIPLVPTPLTRPSLTNLLSLGVILLLTLALGIFGYRQLSRDRVILTQAYPSTPVTPSRQISFQGRLEDSAGTPINSATNLVFKLWDASSGGNQLYSSGTCSITPDGDGVFSTQIGDTCGSAITSSVFTENASVYLEITVASETLTPRQEIATVAYALNSETIQGFPISATVSAVRNTVVPMNQWGEIIVGEQSPRLKGVSGTFAISAPSLSLSTAVGSSGNITLAPDGTGQVNIQGNTTSTNFFNISNAQLTTGSLITGTVANNNSGFNLIDLLAGSSPTSKFSVAANGDTTLAGDLTLSGGNLNTGNIALTLGDATTDSLTLQTDGTGNGEVVLPNDSVGPDEVLSSGQVDGYCLKYASSGDTWSWGTCGSGGGGTTYWRLTNGALSPVNDSLDLLVGADATSSAKAGFININSGTPTATVSAGAAGAASLTATGILGTTAYQSLTLGNSTTGNILLAPGGITALTAAGNDITLVDDLNLATASDLIFGGTTSLGETTGAADSGAYLVGAFDEFTYSSSTNVQGVLKDLDTQVNSLTLGTAGPWTDAGSYMYPTNGEVLGNSAAGGSNKVAGLYLADSSPLAFGTDNDFIFSFNNSSSTLGSTLLAGTRLGIGTTSALATVDIRSSLGTIPVASISGNTSQANLVVDQSGTGDILTASSSGEPRFVVKSNGNVGVGVSNPTTKLQVGGTNSIISNSSGDITIDSFGGQLILADADTLNVGGLTGVTYNALANSGEAPEEAAISSDNDLYIGGDLEIDGTTYLGPTTFGNVVYFAGGSTYYVDSSGNAKFNDLIVADTGNPGLTVGNGTIGFIQVGGSTISDNSSDLTLDSDTTKVVVTDDLQVTGNDLLDSSGTSRVTLGSTTTLTNTTTTLSGTSTLTASSLSSFTTASSLAMNSTTGVTLGDNSTIYGGDNASGTLTLSSTSNGTKGNIQFFSSSNTLSPTGNLTLAGDLAVNGNDITSTSNLSLAATGYVRIGDTGTPSTFGDDDDDLYVTGDIELDGDLLVDGGELYLTPLTSSSSTTEGTVYYDSDVDKLYVYANGAFQRLATNLTSWSANNSSVANGSYVQIAHNSGSNDLTAMGWFLDTVSGLYKNIAEYSHNLIHNLQNQWSDAAYTAFTIDTSGTLRDYLYSYWKMDESSNGSVAVTRNDTYGTNHLTDNNTIASGTGKIDNGADLELSSSEFLEITDNGNLSTGDIDFSLGAWVKLESESAGTTQETIISKYDSGTVREYSLYYTGTTTDRFRFELFDSGGTSRCTSTDTTAVTTATWYYVVAWHDKTANTCNIQVNNNTATSTAESGIPSDTAANVRVGANSTTETAFFDGIIDEVGFWKKVLTSTERTDLYNSGSGNTYASRSGFVRTQANATDVSVTPAIDVGTGADGAITVSSDTNINTTSLISGRSCADGGDAVNYSVSSLTSTTATLESTPSSGCLAVGDEILLINLRGVSSAFGNVGNYETLRIASIASSTVTFTTSKTKYYGDGTSDDSNIGLATTNQAVMLQRVPNYTNVTLSNAGTDFTPSDWVTPTGSANNGAGEGGVMFFRATGTVTVASSTTINTNSKGYPGGPGSGGVGVGGSGGDAFCGAGGASSSSGAAGGGGQENNGAGGTGNCGGGGGSALSTGTGGSGSGSSGGSGGGGGSRMAGGGGGYGTAGDGGGGSTSGSSGGTNSSGNGGNNGGGGGGGGTYGSSTLTQMFYGTGGGGGGFGSTGSVGSGGDGGGIITILANTLSVSGSISSNGGAGGNASGTGGAGGGGSGGSIRIEGSTLTLGSSLVTSSSGAGGTGGSYGAGGAGGSGRIAVYYASSVSGTTSPAATSTFSGYHAYGVYHSPVIATPNAVTLESLRWEYPGGVPTGLKKVEFQTRTGSSTNPTDGTWETWKTSATSSNCASPNCVSLSNGNTHTEWTGTNITVADGDVTRNVDMFEDEDEATAGNITKGTSSTNGGTAEDTISSTDFSNYDYVTFWVRASQSGSSLKFGFGESAGTEQEELIKIDAVDTWQKVYWDLSDIPSSARNAVTKLRFTNLTTSSNVFYFDNVQLEKHLSTASGSAVTSTPNSYFQYRIIFTTTNTAYYPSVENIELLYTDGFKIVQTDTNTVRLYNYTGSTQSLRLEAVTFGADLAEWYTVNDESITAGDLVSLTGELDEYGVPILRKSNSTNDPQLLGVISTKAGQTLGLEAPNRRLLALVGRVPVKMDESSAPLEPGDPLTSSSTPGLARRANAGELSFARSTVAWQPGEAAGVLAIVNNTVPTSGSILVDGALQKLGGAWQVVEQGTGRLVDSVASFGKLIAGSGEVGSLAVDTLSPLASDSALTIQGPIVIKPREQDLGMSSPVLVVDGELSAASISARTARLDSLEVKDLVASRIQAGSIEGLEATIATLSATPGNTLTDSDLDSLTSRIKARLALLTSPATAIDLPTPDTTALPPSPPLADLDVSLASDSGLLASLSTVSLYAESLSAHSGLLALQSEGGLIDLAGGTLLVDSGGSVKMNANVAIVGNLALHPGEDSGLKQLLTVYNEAGDTVAAIDASGSADLASLTTKLITIAAAPNSTSSGLLTSTTSTNATAGESTLISPNTELTINSPFVTPDTLVYLTPTANTDNKVLFVKSKDTGSFTVAIDAPASSDIPFNWWIIRLTKDL